MKQTRTTACEEGSRLVHLHVILIAPHKTGESRWIAEEIQAIIGTDCNATEVDYSTFTKPLKSLIWNNLCSHGYLAFALRLVQIDACRRGRRNETASVNRAPFSTLGAKFDSFRVIVGSARPAYNKSSSWQGFQAPLVARRNIYI